MHRITRKLKDRTGTGEFISFAVVVLTLCVIMVFVIGYSQLFSCLNKLNNSLSVISRVAATSTGIDQAREDAGKIAESTIMQEDKVSNVTVSVEYMDEEVWEEGTLILVEVSADVDTISPLSSGHHTRRAIVSVESVLPGIKLGQLVSTVTESGLGANFAASYFSFRNEGHGLKNVRSASSNPYMVFPLGGQTLVAPSTSRVVYVGPGQIIMYCGKGFYVEYSGMSYVSVKNGQGLGKGQSVGISGNSLFLGMLYSPDEQDSIRDFSTHERIDPFPYIYGNQDG